VPYAAAVVKVGYHVGRRAGRARKQLYTRRVMGRGVAVRASPGTLPGHFHAFSGQRDVGEQVASIASLLRCGGEPERITVISDGSHTDRAKATLEHLHRRLEVRPWTAFLADAPRPAMAEHAERHPLGKKLVALSALGRGSWYADSDVLFFARADDLAQRLGEDGPPLFMYDCLSALDSRVLRAGEADLVPVNSGLVLLRQDVDWEPALDRLAPVAADPRFHTEQTIVHIALHQAGAQPLDPELYVMQVRDQFTYGDAFASARIAARHYVGQIRFKLWQHVPLIA
jgi:hypothetical protein